ncbi:MAG: diaminopimelate epimerase, partial [Planctomycetota bacterium]
MRFTKMHGLGNDYVYIDAISDPGLGSLEWSSLAPGMSDRHRGVGGDGVIVIEAPRQSDCHARMRTFNADGSEAEACGNGTRCVARYLRGRLGYDDGILLIESGSRVLECEPLDEGQVRVSMGAPGLELANCGVLAGALKSVDPVELAVDGHR